MNEEIGRKIKKQGLINGLLLGGILSVTSILYFYFIILIAKSAVSITIGSVLFSYVLPIGISILFCNNLKKRVGGFWNLRQATTGIFIMFFASYLMVYIVKDQLFAKVIEPNMVHKTETAMLNALNKLKESSPQNAKEADLKIAEMRKAFEGERNITIGQQIQTFAVSIIFLFVLSIIFAAFYKNEGQAQSPLVDGPSV
jgi:hypothetical protein